MKLLASSLLSLLSAEYTNDFVLHSKHGREIIESIALENELEIVEEVLPQFWHLRGHRLRRRSADASESHRNLTLYDEVIWAEQQKIHSRVKRDVSMSDPLWDRMWYMNPNYVNERTGQERNAQATRHMNITGAWAQGYTGKGIVVTVLDDGVERTHPDLVENYDAAASYDINNNDPDPTPRYSAFNRNFNYATAQWNARSNPELRLTSDLRNYERETNMHGTRCAGQIAASANNGLCVPGVAYNAKVGGIRMLDGDVTDLVEAKSIGLNPDHIDIYSASWGPDDDGRKVDGPAKLATEAFKYGAQKGRNGLGSIFVWASGNGGKYDDNCNCDGYATSIYTVSVSSTTMNEDVPWYSESCASTMTTTYSSGGFTSAKIVTTDLRGMCTKEHTGTSASAPMAAGMIALMLEANPNLTWRDVQHIIVRTSKPSGLYDPRGATNPGWLTNGAGRQYSHRYGFGLMDAGAMTELAKNWSRVSRQLICERNVISGSSQVSIYSSSSFYNPIIVSFHVSQEDCPAGITQMEHVKIQMNAAFSRRGDLQMILVSPSGTESVIVGARRYDNSKQGYYGHEFMTVHMWDESPYGEWHLKIMNMGATWNHGARSNSSGFLRQFSLQIHGTREGDMPESTKRRNKTKNEIRNGLWPAVNRAYRLPNPRYLYRNEKGDTEKHSFLKSAVKTPKSKLKPAVLSYLSKHGSLPKKLGKNFFEIIFGKTLE